MYHYIKGALTRLGGEYAVIETGGVGYKFFITRNTHAKLAPLLEKEALLYAYLNIRDDAEELYGFFREEERECFVKLLAVSGVGPKAATSVLSLFSPEKLAFAVAAGDAKEISRSNGVGMKTAQKIIIELKGKLDLGEGTDETMAGSAAADAANALAALGYTKSEAAAALAGVDMSLPLEDIITAAFKKLNKF